MIFESLLLPFVVGLVTNKSSAMIFKDEELHRIIEENYHKAEDDFNIKYKNAFGGKYNNFIARQENFELLLNNALSFKETDKDVMINVDSYEGEITPDEVVTEFIIMFKNKIDSDTRLTEYRAMREHSILTAEMYDVIKKMIHIRISKFENVDSYIDNNLDLSSFELEKMKTEATEIIAFLDVNKILLIDSYRGFGKTELIFKVASDESVIAKFDDVIVMKHGVRNILDAFQTEMLDKKSYLIVIDDVDLCLNEFREVLNFIKSSNDNNNKVLMTSQTHNSSKIKDLSTQTGFINEFKQISINNWEQKDFIELLRSVAEMGSIEDEEMIVAKYQSPSVLSWIGKSLANSENITIDELFIEYKELLKNDVFEILKDTLSVEECNKMIFNLSCTVPLLINEKYLELINTSFGKPIDLKGIINKLVSAGILRIVGNKYRFLPDFKGDIYLAYSLNEDDYIEELSFWIKNMQEKVLENIGEARLICEIDINEKLKPLIAEWSDSDNYFTQSNLLKQAYHLISFAPDSILNLIYCYLEYAEEVSGDKYSRLTTDNFGPVIIKMWHYSSNKIPLLEFIRRMECSNLDGVYDNYKVNGIIKEILSPVNSSTDEINNSLEVIEEWLRKDLEGSIDLFSYAASEILKGSHEVSKSIINGIQLGQRVVNLSDGIIKVRRKCITIIEYLLTEKAEFKNIKGIEDICLQFSDTNWGNIKLEELPLYSEIIKERELLVKILGESLLHSTINSHNVLLERILIRWWALQYQGTSGIEEYLSGFERSPEYLFIKYYVDADYRIIDFTEIIKAAPVDDRWKWFVDNVMSYNAEVRDDFVRIAEMVHGKISTITELYSFLNESSKSIEQLILSWSKPNILSEWYKINAELFNKFIQSDNYSETYPVFRGDILKSVVLSASEVNSELIDEMLMIVEALSYDEISTLLTIAENSNLDDNYVVSMIERIIDCKTFEMPGNLIHRMYFIFKNRDRKLVVNLLLKIISKFPYDSLGNMLSFIIQHFIEDIRADAEFAMLKQSVIELLYIVDKFKYHENKILTKLLFSMEEAINFIEKRIKLAGDEYFRKIPFDGFTFLESFIINVGDYNDLIVSLKNLLDSDIIQVYDLQTISKPYFMKKDNENNIIGSQLLEKYIVEDKPVFVHLIMACFNLNLESINKFADGVKFLNENGLGEEAESIIYSHKYFEGATNRTKGKISSDKLYRMELYSALYDLLPFGKLRVCAESCLEYLKRSMENDIKSDEESFNPR